MIKHDSLTRPTEY